MSTHRGRGASTNRCRLRRPALATCVQIRADNGNDYGIRHTACSNGKHDHFVASSVFKGAKGNFRVVANANTHTEREDTAQRRTGHGTVWSGRVRSAVAWPGLAWHGGGQRLAV